MHSIFWLRLCCVCFFLLKFDKFLCNACWWSHRKTIFFIQINSQVMWHIPTCWHPSGNNKIVCDWVCLFYVLLYNSPLWMCVVISNWNCVHTFDDIYVDRWINVMWTAFQSAPVSVPPHLVEWHFILLTVGACFLLLLLFMGRMNAVAINSMKKNYCF